MHRLKKHQAQLVSFASAASFILICASIGLAVFSLFYNLGLNPRPWADEGSTLALARTLAQDGIYATHTATGYDSYGAVQSVGPTVIAPLALSLKLLGVGLLPGRAVIACYALLALVALYGCARQMGLGRVWALLAPAILLFASGTFFLAWSRQALGEVPAFAFFCLAWWLWAHPNQPPGQPSWVRDGLCGLCLGAALITKSQYLLFGVGLFALIVLLDVAYYRQRQTLRVLGICGIGLACYAAWVAWQMLYFGADAFSANLSTLNQLARVTTRPNTLGKIASGLRGMLGRDQSYFYLLWALPAWAYGLLSARPRTWRGLQHASLLVFGWMWLVYAIGFYHTPWPPLFIAPGAVMAILLAGWAQALFQSVRNTPRQQWTLAQPEAVVRLSPIFMLLMLGLWVADQSQTTLRFDVLDKEGQEGRFPRAPQLGNANNMADLIRVQVPPDAIIETWERELTILTTHTYHHPPQSLLIQTQVARETGSTAHSLGAAYFATHSARYLVIGPSARDHRVYQEGFLKAQCRLISGAGEGTWRYELHLCRPA